MKRELEFRAWNGETMNHNIIVGKFGAFWVNPGAKNNGLDENDSASLTPFNTKCSENTIIMQYSGVNDKNDKRIYEGDIFKLGAEKEVFEVRFEHGCFMAFCKGKQYGLIGELQICFIDVIGNVHQNAELL